MRSSHALATIKGMQTARATQAARRPGSTSTREVARADVPRLIEMNRLAYPELIEPGIVWTKAQLHAHLRVFPCGQRVALDGSGRVVGAIATLIAPRTIDPLAPHTWLEITGNGFFATHDDRGDTLYLADVYVDPAARGRGIAARLYADLKRLCCVCGLRRVVAGGRLWSYYEYGHRMSPMEYAQRVARGELRDRVLGSQLRAGFVVRAILENYVFDPRSANFATLLEWEKPDLRDRPRAR